MDPAEVRQDSVASSTTPADGVAPAGTAPVAAARYAPAAPVVPGAPVATGTGVYSSKTSVYPVGYRSIQLIWLIAGVVDFILALDFIFRAVGAHNTSFAHYIYRIGGWLAAPFLGIFNTTVAANGTSVIQWADVLAVAIYTVAAWVVTKVIRILTTPRTGVTTV